MELKVVEDRLNSPWLKGEGGLTLQHWLCDTLPLLTEGLAEYRFFNFILQRTIRYGKVAEFIQPEHFENGIITDKMKLIGIGVKRTQRYELTKRLIKKGLLLETARFENLYLLNLPAIIKMWRDTWGITLFDSIEAPFKKRYAEFYKEEEMPKMEEMMDRGKEVSKKAKVIKLRKINEKPQEDLKWIEAQVLMKDFCEEFGRRYSDTVTKKVKGQARNWLKSCASQGKDARKILEKAAKYWPYIQLYEHEKSSKSLPSWISMTDFFKYRDQIEGWIIMHEEDAERKFTAAMRFKNVEVEVL